MLYNGHESGRKDPYLPFSSGTPEEKGPGDEEAKKGALMDHPFNNQKDFARHLRSASTEVEVTMWQLLCNRQRGVKLRRQHPIGPFIVDFYCSEAKLVVECDGAPHFIHEGRMKVERRTSWLSSRDIEVNGSSSPCPFSSEYRGEGSLQNSWEGWTM